MKAQKYEGVHDLELLYDNDSQDRTRRYFGDLYPRIQSAEVLIVGAGAIGNEVVKNLAMLGVRKIHLVDFDKVSASNLNRCVFFRPGEHNKAYKVNVIRERVCEIWKDCEIIAYPVAIQDAPESLWQLPIAIIAVDNNEARYHCNLQAFAQENPPFLINGAMGRTFLEIQVLLPHKTACMVCTWSKEYIDRMFHRMVRQTCDQFFSETIEHFPAISVLNSMVGAMMSSECSKILVGLPRWKAEGVWEPEHIPILGKSMHYDISTQEFTISHLTPNPKCSEVFCTVGK